MKAAVLNSIPGRLDIEDVDIGEPGPREVLIRTAAAGLCHSDLHFMEGNYTFPCPAVLGMIPVGTKIEIHGAELLYEKTLTGSNMGSNQFRTDMPRFVDMYLDGRLHLDEMVSKTIILRRDQRRVR